MGLEIQYGRQNIISFVLSCHCSSKICQKDSPHQNIFKLTSSQKSFYVFRKDRHCKFIFLLSPSLDVINIIYVWALEAMEVASETLPRSRCTSPAAGSYLQPCPWGQGIKFRLFLTYYKQFMWTLPHPGVTQRDVLPRMLVHYNFKKWGDTRKDVNKGMVFQLTTISLSYNYTKCIVESEQNWVWDLWVKNCRDA